MYKTQDGKKHFSMFNLINNAFPNFANDAKDDVELTSMQKDELFLYQMQEPNPKALGQLAFFRAGICGDAHTSKQIHSCLLKNHCLGRETGLLDTTKITKHFANEVPYISVHAQRKLITLMFFWEAEDDRREQLDQRKAEYEKKEADARKAGDEDMAGKYAATVAEIEKEKNVRPSVR